MGQKSMAHQTAPVYRILNLDRACEIASHVEVAVTSSDRRRGLLNKMEMSHSAGLWLAPCEAVHTFGMKMPIDVIFLDRKYRALKLVSNLVPSRISLCLTGHSVLELAGGSIVKCGLQRGDRLQFQANREAA